MLSLVSICLIYGDHPCSGPPIIATCHTRSGLWQQYYVKCDATREINTARENPKHFFCRFQFRSDLLNDFFCLILFSTPPFISLSCSFCQNFSICSSFSNWKFCPPLGKLIWDCPSSLTQWLPRPRFSTRHYTFPTKI